MKRKEVRQALKEMPIETILMVGKSELTPKQREFARQVALGNSGAESYRKAYSDKGSKDTQGNNASRLKADTRIKAEIERIERANELAALHSAAGLKSIVISTLAEIATSVEEKGAVRVQAVRAIGQLVGVDAFRETKRVEHVKDSGEIRAQILDQLKTMMLGSADAVDVDADSLLEELSGPEPHPGATPQDAEWDSGSHIHTNPHEPSPHLSEDPPSPSETHTPQGDISGENGDLAK